VTAKDVRWLDQVVLSGEVVLRLGHTSTGAFTAEWPHEAVLQEQGGVWIVETAPDLPLDRTEKLVRGPIRAVQRYVGGEMSLHASAVALHDRAIVFIGNGGAGKSTIAATLCDAHGAQLLSDDVLAVEWSDTRLIALPTEGLHWFEATNEEVKLSRKAVAAEHPTTVVAIVALALNEATRAAQRRPLRGRPAMLALSQAHITLPIATRQQRMRDFEWVATLCTHVPIVEITRRCDTNPNEVALAALQLLEQP
jgi:hypothetical protein